MAIDPRAKLLWALGGIILVFALQTLHGQIVLSLILLMLVMIFPSAGRKIRATAGWLLMLLPLTLFLHLLFSTSLVGDLFRGTLSENWLQQLRMPLVFTVRLGNLIVAMAVLLWWIPAIDFLDGVYLLMRPLRRFRFPVDDLFHIIFIAVRFFPLLRQEYRQLDEGWKAFLPQSRTGLRARLETLRLRLVPLMIFSFRKADILADAMSIRGYGHGRKRSYFTRLHFGRVDLAVTMAALLLYSTIFLLIC